MYRELRKSILKSVITGILFTLISFYLFLPPISVYAGGFWFWIATVIFSFSWPFIFASYQPASQPRKRVRVGSRSVALPFWERDKLRIILVAAVLLPLLFWVFGAFFTSAPFFHARSYAGVIEVEEAVFSEDMPEVTEVTDIALMDSESAAIIGNRTLGALSNVVSQYHLYDEYTQINYRNSPQKIAPLQYAGFFKWLGNRANGIPGYVLVDPVNSSAKYVELEKPLRYSESGFFGDELARALRFAYPTKMFGSVSFEIDDQDRPFYVVACMAPRVGLFGAYDVTEVILFDPCTGESDICAVEDAPAWVDIVYTGYLATEKYNWRGMLSGGYINSLIGNVGCNITTDDFGYIVRDDDVWYFTGVTSVVEDASNIGFILSNARTGAYKYYPVVGAEEYSAMGAAQGEVQEKGYIASFPSLVNIAGEATYIMVLKDDNGLVKLYALVNVENYSIVATGVTQSEAMSTYRKLLRQSGVGAEDGGTLAHADVHVADVRVVTLGGVPTLYVVASDGIAYKGYLENDETLIRILAGDILRISYRESGEEGVRLIESWEDITP